MHLRQDEDGAFSLHLQFLLRSTLLTLPEHGCGNCSPPTVMGATRASLRLCRSVSWHP